LEGLKEASGSKIAILAVGTGLLAAGIIAYLTSEMTLGGASYACRVQGIPCPQREGATLSMGRWKSSGEQSQ